MQLHGSVSITGTIKINDREARVLQHLTSYSLTEWFTKVCNSREIPLEEIDETLKQLRTQLYHIVNAKEAADKLLKTCTKEAKEA